MSSNSPVDHETNVTSELDQPTGKIVHMQEWDQDSAPTLHRPEISTFLTPMTVPHVWPSLTCFDANSYSADCSEEHKRNVTLTNHSVPTL